MFSLAGDDDFKDAVRNISSFELITIPGNLFSVAGTSRESFHRSFKNDNFESMLVTKDGGSKVEIFVQSNGNQSNRYLVWTEDSDSVTAIEIEGQIDIKKLLKQRKTLADQSN